MPEILVWSGVFIASLFVLVKAADYFIQASERTGLALGIPPFIIGLTLVALGTSLPELITSIIAVLSGAPEIVLGNVVGSNISNICLILGMVGVLAKRVQLTFELMRVDLPLMMGSAFYLAIAVWDGEFSTFEGLLCIAGMGIYLAYVLNVDRADHPALEEENDDLPRPSFSWKEPVILLLSGVAIYFGADFLIRSITKLSGTLGIGADFIALTAVSLGTSLPELVVSIAAIRMKNAEMAVGNILGSNIFNIFAVMGIPSLFGTLTVTPSILEFGMPMMIIASFLCLFSTQDKVINRWEGWMLILFYVFFIGNMISGEIAG